MNDYQVMPPLTDEEYEELKADISLRGVMVPIEYDERGNVLDGHHRLKACEELGIKDYPKVIRAGLTVEEKFTHARKLNMARRHLNREQRQELIRQQLRETPYKSDLKIAKALGVSDKTVEAQREKLEEGGEIKSVDAAIQEKIAENPNASDRQIARDLGISDKSVGARRKKRGAENSEFPNIPQAHKPVSVFNPSKREESALRDKRVVDRMQESRSGAISAAKQIAKEEKEDRKAYRPLECLPDDAARLFTADIVSGVPEVADSSVDFIITDPPYSREYLPLYYDLALVAARTLKPGGSLLAMCGQSYLPQVYAALSSALTYHWTLCYLTPGGQSPQLFSKRVNTFWKPILWLVKGTYSKDYVGDVIKSPVNDNDKEYHKWGQSVGGFADIIERFTYPGDVIFDPFVGGGTVGVAAVVGGRMFIGTDIDTDCIKTAKERIDEAYERSARRAD